jgi:hypothetical protein
MEHNNIFKHILRKIYIYIFIIIISFPILVLAQNENLIIKCMETTGTGRQDIFKINKPEFFWYYNSKWYELAVSQKGVAKDWDIDFKENLIRLYNKKMEWIREIDLTNMTAYMKFPTGEQYLYECEKT